MLKVISVVGARPNFMKIAPIIHEMQHRAGSFNHLLVHTGQHYDQSMSESFFDELDVPKPDINLEVGSGSHAQQAARIMLAFEPVLEANRPDWVVVVGDVNSTMAATLVAAKLLVPVAHVEAGLRSRDRTMPEEINRIVTDALADLLLTPSVDADENLRREGVPAEKIRMVGNVMIDSLMKNLERARRSDVLERLGLEKKRFCAMTLHRPSNVDHRETLRGIIDAIEHIQTSLPVVFPVHPRTKARLRELGLEERVNSLPHVILTEPMGYLDFLQLYSNSRLVMTDSGGIQEETTALGIPCLTLRDNTERPITVTQGTNRLVGNNPEVIRREAEAALDRGPQNISIPKFWDGKTAGRILEALEQAS